MTIGRQRALTHAQGVVVMSFMAQEDSLLARTNEDFGSLVYFLGTFGLHYWPVVVTVSELEVGGARYTKAVLAAGPGVTFSLCVAGTRQRNHRALTHFHPRYCIVNRAEEVYGVPLPMDTALALGGVYAGLAATTAWYLN